MSGKFWASLHLRRLTVRASCQVWARQSESCERDRERDLCAKFERVFLVSCSERVRSSAVCGVLSGTHTRSLSVCGLSVISQCLLRLRDTSARFWNVFGYFAYIISVKGVSCACAYYVLTPQAIVSVL